MRERHPYLLGYLLGIVLFFGVWWAGSWLVQTLFASEPFKAFALPSPERAVQILIEDWVELSKHFFASGYRVLAGILLALVIAAPLGLVIGHERQLDRLFSPSIYLSYPIPKVVFLPLLFVFLGIYDAPKIGLIMIILVFQILLSARDAAKSISKSHVLAVASTGASTWQIYKHVVIPGSLPAILSTLRISVGMAIMALALTESFAAQYGLWMYIARQWRLLAYDSMFAGILAMGLLGLLFYILIDVLERWICKWQYLSHG
ncbi:MAG: ABC transporter permease [Candidatus Bipolaricaulota bacterium]|nr:ABC transporter permease [Candidatus Bipolaricaulota bacterium]MDW8140887.1 ABC transporter permease [Candidatus Bipolaricaulota bacterium]